MGKGLPGALLGGFVRFWMAGMCHLGSVSAFCLSKLMLRCREGCAIPSKI